MKLTWGLIMRPAVFSYQVLILKP